ncbi:MAG: DUF5753 domain-containing protein, partial [Pseudonocardiaceae bacterium]
VLWDAALTACLRDRAIGRAQLEHLINQAQPPNVELRILPFDIGLHVGMAGSFTLLRFPDGLLPDAAHQEYAVGGHIVDAKWAVNQLTTLYDELRGQALDATESLAVIAEFVDRTI